MSEGHEKLKTLKTLEAIYGEHNCSSKSVIASKCSESVLNVNSICSSLKLTNILILNVVEYVKAFRKESPYNSSLRIDWISGRRNDENTSKE